MKLLSINYCNSTFSIEKNGEVYTGSFGTCGGFVTVTNLIGYKANLPLKFRIETFLYDVIL